MIEICIFISNIFIVADICMIMNYRMAQTIKISVEHAFNCRYHFNQGSNFHCCQCIYQVIPHSI
uniref:Uncharacterized protein n=1 Tax=Arundo donax TaxID=35708 RepID=A0A0A9H2E3_ARUDO